MKIRTLSFKELQNLYESNGWEVVSNDYFDEQNRIILNNGKRDFILQYQKHYNFITVYNICSQMGMDCPEEHLNCYRQVQNMRDNKKS